MSAICVLALDHRDAMRNSYVDIGIHDVTDEVMLAAKTRIIDALASQASSILLDSLAVELPRPRHLALLMPLESQGHEDLDGGRLNQLMPDFSPARAAELGASGCKLLLYYRADHPATAKLQLELTARAAKECHKHGVTLVVEPKVYKLAGEDKELYVRRFGDLVVAAARHLARSGADLLKLQYPGSPELCERVTEAAAPVPWALLGGKIDGETFAAQLDDSCQAGASGFIAGRAIWGGALGLDPREQSNWLERDARPLLERLCNITEAHATKLA